MKYNKDYSYNINFDYDGSNWYLIRLYVDDIENCVIYEVGKNYGYVLETCGVEFIDSLYKYFRETYTDYFNALDMGLL